MGPAEQTVFENDECRLRPGCVARFTGVELNNDECMTRLGSAFPALETVDGGVRFDQLEKLTSVDGVLPLLKSVTKDLQFQNNRYLTNLNGAFKSLKTVGGQLYFYGNGRGSCGGTQCSQLSSFCDSTKAFMCPLTARCVLPWRQRWGASLLAAPSHDAVCARAVLLFVRGGLRCRSCACDAATPLR